MVNQSDLPMEQRIEKLHERYGNVSVSLAIGSLDDWVVGIHFGQEAEDSPMCGGAAYGVGSCLRDALMEALDQA